MMGGEIRNNSSQDCSVSWNDAEFWISGVLFVILGTIGALGNSLNMAALCKPHIRKTCFNNLLLALCCFDNNLYSPGSGPAIAYNSFACHAVNLRESFVQIFGGIILGEIGFLGSMYMTIAISLERFLGICYAHCRFSRRPCMYILLVILIS